MNKTEEMATGLEGYDSGETENKRRGISLSCCPDWEEMIFTFEEKQDRRC